MTREQELELKNLELQMQVSDLSIRLLNLQGLSQRREYEALKARVDGDSKKPKRTKEGASQ